MWATHLFDWDEINFAECAREMLKTHDYTRVYIDFKPFWEKPPMFFWMQAVSMKVFGVNEFAARFPNALCGIATLIAVYLCGARIRDKKFGMFWACAFGGSIFPNMYFKSGIIDPWYNLFTFLSLYFFIRYCWRKNEVEKEDVSKRPVTWVVYSAILMGLATLTKGPVALIVFFLVFCTYLVWNRFRFRFNWAHAVLFIVVTMLVTFTWYGYETVRNGPLFIIEFFKYQYRLLSTHDAGQKGFWGYHYVVILIGCFPSSIFAIPSFFKTPSNSPSQADFKRWMIILFWVVTILFTIVQSRIIHYSSLAWFPVTFLAANSFYEWEKRKMNFRKYTGIMIIVIGGLIGIAVVILPFFAIHIRDFVPYVHDKFAQANMEADVHWSGWETLIGWLLLITILLGVISLRRNQFRRAAWIFFGGTAAFIFLVSAVIIPKIERYSQGAAIDFFEQRKGEDCYTATLGYKSYAPLFYTAKERPVNNNSYDLNWLLTGKIDKRVYFVSRVNRVDDYLRSPGIKELYRKNGYVFLVRDKPSYP